MPKVDPKAVLELSDIQRAWTVAVAKGPFEAALFAWMYEFGARAAEPGLQLIKSLDLRASRARPVRLKDRSALGGSVHQGDWYALLPFCRTALPPWLEAREARLKRTEQRELLFPGARPGRCYACQGTGQRTILLLLENGARGPGDKVKCHHCNHTGKRWGISRVEVHTVISKVLEAAGAPIGRRHPHVLRHSIISHLLENGIPATVVQDRVGHKLLGTTLSYARATRAAAAQMETALSRIYVGEALT